MGWYDGYVNKIITDEDFGKICNECNNHQDSANKTKRCKGDVVYCPRYTKVRTLDYDKKVRNDIIEEFSQKLLKQAIIDKSVVRRVSEQMKGV